MGRTSPINIPELSSVPPRQERVFARAPAAGIGIDASAGIIDFYGEIGPDISAAAFRDRLRALSNRDLTIKMNSPGGDVFQSVAMHTDLRAHKGRVRVEVVGVAASGASLVAMAADEIAIAASGFVMIHNSHGLGIGDKHTHADLAALLSKVDESLASAYAERTRLSIADVHALMDQETWFRGQEAVENGFATEVIGDSAPRASFDLARTYRNVPNELRVKASDNNSRERPPVESAEQILALLLAGGVRSRMARKITDAARPLIAKGDDSSELITQLIAATAAHNARVAALIDSSKRK